MNRINIAFSGFGSIGRIHLLGYRDIGEYYPGSLPEIRIKGLLASTPERGEKAAADAGIEKAYSSFDELVADPEIDVVDIVSPNYLHREQILKAVKAGKHVLCEKPLTLNGDDAVEVLDAAKGSGKTLGMIFNYRFIPAIIKAKELIDAGRLGEVYSFRGEYFHTGYQNPGRPFSWRMDFSRSGGGALADLGVHVIDLLAYLLGDFKKIKAETKTFISERPEAPGASTLVPVTVDDAAWLQCELLTGSTGTVEVSRFATGTLDELNLTVFGSRGSFRFNLMDPGYLYWFDEDQKSDGWKRLETVQHYPGAVIPTPRSVLGWQRFHCENQYRFLKSLVDGTEFKPGIKDGAKAQFVLDAAYRSAESGKAEMVRKNSRLNS